MIDFRTTTDTDRPRPGCELSQAALQRLLDGEADWDAPEAVTHRTACVGCREELILARAISAGVKPTTVPSGLGDRVHAAAITAHRRRRYIRYAGVAGSLAALILVALFAFQPTRQTITERQAVAALPRGKDKAEPVKPLGEAVSEARDALVSLTRRTATETRQTSSNLIPTPKLPDMPDTGDGLDPLVDAQTAAARSVNPIKSSAQRAINLFLRAADPPNKPAVQ